MKIHAIQARFNTITNKKNQNNTTSVSLRQQPTQDCVKFSGGKDFMEKLTIKKDLVDELTLISKKAYANVSSELAEKIESKTIAANKNGVLWDDVALKTKTEHKRNEIMAQLETAKYSSEIDRLNQSLSVAPKYKGKKFGVIMEEQPSYKAAIEADEALHIARFADDNVIAKMAEKFKAEKSNLQNKNNGEPDMAKVVNKVLTAMKEEFPELAEKKLD